MGTRIKIALIGLIVLIVAIGIEVVSGLGLLQTILGAKDTLTQLRSILPSFPPVINVWGSTILLIIGIGAIGFVLFGENLWQSNLEIVFSPSSAEKIHWVKDYWRADSITPRPMAHIFRVYVRNRGNKRTIKNVRVKILSSRTPKSLPDQGFFPSKGASCCDLNPQEEELVDIFGIRTLNFSTFELTLIASGDDAKSTTSQYVYDPDISPPIRKGQIRTWEAHWQNWVGAG